MTIVIASGGRVAFTDMIGDVRAHIPMIVEFIAEQNLIRACREFCQKSNVWRSTQQTLLTTAAGQTAYTFDLPADGEVWRVASAWAGGSELDVMLPGEQDGDPDATGSDDFVIGTAPPDQLLLVPGPLTAGVTIKGSLVFVPSDAASGLPTAIWSQYRRGIAHGAIADAVSEPGKPWSSPGAFAYHRGIFDEQVAKASYESGPVRRRPLRVTPC